MKIMILSHNYPCIAFGYSGIFIHEQAKALHELGMNIRVICPTPFAPWPITLFNSKWQGYASTPKEDIIESINVRYSRYISYSNYHIHTASKRYYKGVSRDFKKIHCAVGGIDIIHAHFVIPDGLAATYIGSEFSIPVVVTAHGSDVNKFPSYDERLKSSFSDTIKHSDAVVTVSNVLKKKVEMYSSPRRVESIPMGVDTRIFRPANNVQEVRQRLSLPLDTHVILFVGRPEYEKGIFELIKAFKIVCQSIMNVILAVVGYTQSSSECVSYIQHNGLADRVRILGSLPHIQVRDWMSACDIFVLPSHSEGLPTVVVEAMACGRAVVATPVGGVPQILEDGQNGIITPVKKPEILAEKIRLLIEDPNLRERYGRAARETVVNGYDVRISASRLISIYNELLYSYRFQKGTLE